MSYCSDDDIRYYLDAGGGTGIGTNVIGTYATSQAMAWADSIIDLKLSKRYSVPFGTATLPPAIKSISTTLSAWKSLRSIYSGEIPSSLATVKEEYDRAMSFLDEIRNGDMDLPSGTVAGGGNVTESGESTKFWSSTMNYTPIFDVDDELNWAVDTDRISDIADARE
jgi:phage gp36-like protein